MTPDLFSQIVAAAACIVILWRAEPAINRMRARSSPILLRLSFWCLAVAAIGALVEIVRSGPPPWPATVGAIGVALLLFCERRIRYLTRRPPRSAPMFNDHRTSQDEDAADSEDIAVVIILLALVALILLT